MARLCWQLVVRRSVWRISYMQKSKETIDVKSQLGSQKPTRTPPVGIELYYGAVAEANRSSAGSVSDVVSEEERSTADRFKFERDRLRYLATRRMVRNLLSKYADIEPDAWKFETNEFGKPSIDPEQYAGLYFNVSHTSSTIVCAVAIFPHIGVDIEDQIHSDYHEVATRFFANDEQEWLRAAESVQDESARFLAIWTLKEAYIKAVGKGLTIPLTSFSVFPHHERWFAVENDGKAERWSFRKYFVGDSTIAVVFPNRFESMTCHLREFAID